MEDDPDASSIGYNVCVHRRTAMTGAVVGALIAVLVGCHSKPAEPDRGPSPGPKHSSGAAAARSHAVAVYAHLLAKTHRASGTSWTPVYVDKQPGGGKHVIPRATRNALTKRLQDQMRIRWVAHPPHALNHVFVALPRLRAGQRRFHVHYSLVCGNLCGTGIRYLITHRAGAWHIRQIGPTAIS